MELIGGGDLRTQIKPEGISWQDALPFICQIFLALEAIHSKGIIHRDLKPENLLLTQSGLIKLTDFGLAKELAESQFKTARAFLGTSAYISPERIIDPHETSFQSDLYSAGVICYELITGKNPFLGNNQMETLLKHTKGPVPILKTSSLINNPSLNPPLPPTKLTETITALLAKKPEDRLPHQQKLF